MKMLNYSFNCLVIPLLLLAFYSCSRQKGVKDIIVQAENIVEQQPDSALRLLNTVLFPEDLDKSRFNKYNLLLLEAKDKSYKDITSDTLIFAIKDYYFHKKDYPNAALAAFYCGRVRHGQNNMEEAIAAYMEAEKLADKTGNYNLKGLIQSNLGILHREHSSYEKAVELLKKAVGLYEKAKNHVNEINTLRIIGDCFGLSKKLDSAFYYYNASLNVAVLYNIMKQQSGIKENIGVTYMKEKNYEQAKKFLKEALAFPEDSVEQARILLNIAQVYVLENNIDSVDFYLDKTLVLHTSDPWIVRSSYLLKSKVAEKNSRYQEALNDYKEYYSYTTKVFDSEKNNKLLEVQGKYDYEKLKNAQNQLIINQQRAGIVLALALFAAGIIIYVFYRKSVLNKKFRLETEQKIESLQKMSDDFSKEKQSFRNIVIQHFDIIKKTTLLESEISEEERKSGQKLLKKFNKIVYGQDTLNWDTLYSIMNSLHNGLYDEVKKMYSQWDEMDFRIFCMSNENQFNDNEIAVILNNTIPMIRKIRSKIRKDMGIPKYSHDFISFFKKNRSFFLCL